MKRMYLHDEWKRKLVGRNVSPTPPFPAKLKVDICGLCNHSCLFCPGAIQRKTQGNMDDALLRRIITDAYYAGAKELSISGMGETLLNPKLEEYITLAKELGYEYVFINTNGALLNEHRARTLLESGLNSVKFSVNGGDAEVYRLVHGVDCFDDVLENIKNFDMERKRSGRQCHLYVSFIAVQETLHSADMLAATLAGHVDEIVVAHANNRGGSLSGLESNLLGSDAYAFQFPCGQLFDTAMVLAEGYLVICCQDYDKFTVIADLHDMSIMDAWKCEKFVDFRKKYLERNFAGTLCNNCLFGRYDPVVSLTPEITRYPIDERKKANREKRIKMLQKMNALHQPK